MTEDELDQIDKSIPRLIREYGEAMKWKSRHRFRAEVAEQALRDFIRATWLGSQPPTMAEMHLEMNRCLEVAARKLECDPE